MSGMKDRSSLKRAARAAIVWLAAGAMTFSSVADGFARSLGGGGRGVGGDGMRTPGGGGRFPGNDGPRYPGGSSGPRFPGGGVMPGGYGPGNTVVIVDDDDAPMQRRRSKKTAKKQKPKKQQQQIVQRGGFNAPPPGEARDERWEALKAAERAHKGATSALDGVAKALPLWPRSRMAVARREQQGITRLTTHCRFA